MTSPKEKSLPWFEDPSVLLQDPEGVAYWRRGGQVLDVFGLAAPTDKQLLTAFERMLLDRHGIDFTDDEMESYDLVIEWRDGTKQLIQPLCGSYAIQLQISDLTSDAP